MGNESKKDFNAMMNNSKDMPKIVELDEEGAKKWGGRTMVIAPPITYNEVIKKIPKGKLVTTKEIREYVAKKYNTEITCPLTAGIFINICAWARYQRDNETPYWRVLKTKGELNPKYPEGMQKQKLIEEGHTIIQKGKNEIVEDYQSKIYDIKKM